MEREEEQMVEHTNFVEAVEEDVVRVSCTGRPDVMGLELAETWEAAVVLVGAAQRKGSHQEVIGMCSGEVVMERDYVEVVPAEEAARRSDKSLLGRELGALEAIASLLVM
jgi:hypothetical protein